MGEVLIKYKGVRVSQDFDTVLRGVDLELCGGSFVYIIGKVGSGKSSLLKTMYAELDITDGEAEVLGFNLRKLKQKQVPKLRRRLGIVFQDFQLLHDQTVYRNLRFVLKATGWKDKKKIDQRIDEVLEAVGMADRKESMPHELSGGEQQRISIARALLNHPKIIIADEPTGNLDPETACNIVKLLKDITTTGTAVVMSTHNIGLVNKYPGIAFQCQDGKMEQVIVRKAEPKVDEVKN